MITFDVYYVVSYITYYGCSFDVRGAPLPPTRGGVLMTPVQIFAAPSR